MEEKCVICDTAEHEKNKKSDFCYVVGDFSTDFC